MTKGDEMNSEPNTSKTLEQIADEWGVPYIPEENAKRVMESEEKGGMEYIRERCEKAIGNMEWWDMVMYRVSAVAAILLAIYFLGSLILPLPSMHPLFVAVYMESYTGFFLVGALVVMIMIIKVLEHKKELYRRDISDNTWQTFYYALDLEDTFKRTYPKRGISTCGGKAIQKILEKNGIKTSSIAITSRVGSFLVLQGQRQDDKLYIQFERHEGDPQWTDGVSVA